MTASNEHDNNYAVLKAALDAAYDQAATGKGAERHANGKPWTEQPIFTISEAVGPGFCHGQAIKKLTEAASMMKRGGHAAARHEVLGAIVYAAALVRMLDEIPPE